MSLRSAVEGVVKDMDEVCNELLGNQSDYELLRDEFYSTLKMLRMALKASEGEQAQSQQQYVPPNVFNRVEIEKAKAEFRNNKDPEHGEPQLVRVFGGPADDTHHAIPAEMPMGAFTAIGSSVYSRRPDGLQYVDDLKANE